MRIWDINPGYLNRQSLLGEHSEVHAIASIIVKRKKGYAKHPETIRWIGFGWALKMRHLLLAAEMSLRGLNEQSPLVSEGREGSWPGKYIDAPHLQFEIIRSKYKNKEQGRIPLPTNAQELWGQHKYSLLSRNVEAYKELGRAVSKIKPYQEFSLLAETLTEWLKRPPSMGGLRNALQHMWGHVSDYYSGEKDKAASWGFNRLLGEIQRLAIANKEQYLMSSTALSELKVWIGNQ